MESSQCLETFPDQLISIEMCYPTRETILNQTNEMLASYADITDVYIATDDVNVYTRLGLTFDPRVCGSYNNHCVNVTQLTRLQYIYSIQRDLKWIW